MTMVEEQRRPARAADRPTPAQLAGQYRAAADRFSRCGRIAALVCEEFGISLVDLLSDRRAREVARPRMVALYLAKTLTDLSLPQIGRAFSRDHTTVMHACNEIIHRCTADAVFKLRVDKLAVLAASELAQIAEDAAQRATGVVTSELQDIVDKAFRRDAIGAAEAVMAALRDFLASKGERP